MRSESDRTPQKCHCSSLEGRRWGEFPSSSFRYTIVQWCRHALGQGIWFCWMKLPMQAKTAELDQITTIIINKNKYVDNGLLYIIMCGFLPVIRFVMKGGSMPSKQACMHVQHIITLKLYYRQGFMVETCSSLINAHITIQNIILRLHYTHIMR